MPGNEIGARIELRFRHIRAPQPVSAMRILFDYPEPALLVHGGMQVQIVQTRAALEELGCQVEYLRWWDEQQQGDILHYFGRLAPDYIVRAHEKGIRVVLAALRGAQC